MIERCRRAGLKEPEFKPTDGFVTTIRRKPGRAFEAVGGKPESQPELLGIRILHLLEKELLGKAELSGKLGQKEISGHLNKTIRMFLSDLLIEMTLPDKPNSRLQKYRLTEKGKEYMKSQKNQ